MVAHIVLITLGYAGQDARNAIVEAWRLTVDYPGMLLAVAGTACLVMVTATSIKRARAKLRYESWHLLHLYAYLGVGLSLPHELWTGADFVASPLARAYWWTLYLTAAASIVCCRIGLPIWRTLRHDLRVAAIVPESPGVTSVYLRGRHLDRMRVQAGQFFHWRFLGAPGWTRAHPYSLSAAPRPDLLRVTVKDLGDGSAEIGSLKPGLRVMVEGPYGRMTGATRRRRHLTFLACGIGITPMRALLESEFYRPGEAVLIYRARTAADFTFYAEIDRLARERGIAVHYLAGPRGTVASWLPSGFTDEIAALHWLAPDVLRSDVYVCGPPPWMDAVTDTLIRAGVARHAVHTEKFGW
jgi:ferredoxin-NADP reductase